MGIHPYLGANVSPRSVQELYYRNLLDTNETLFAIFDGILFDEQGRHVGGFSVTDFIILTDQRLLTWARGMFSDSVDGFSWKDVDVIEARTWDPLHGSVSLAFRVGSFIQQRQLRVNVKGYPSMDRESERIVINKLDYMPASDVPIMEEMVAWIGDQVVANVSGQALNKAFSAKFSYTTPEEQPTLGSGTYQDPYDNDSPEPEAKAPKRGWWIFGKKSNEDVPTALADNPEQLVAAYEHQRSGGRSSEPAPMASAPTQGVGPLSRSASSVTSVVDRVGVYDVSRGLRLFFDTPRQLGVPINKMVSSAIESVGSLQDPDLPQKAATGIQAAINTQQQNLLGLIVEPVVQAVLKPGKKGKGEQGERGVSRRRIQINSNELGTKRDTRQPLAHTSVQAQEIDAGESLSDIPTRKGDAQASSSSRARDNARRPVSIRKSKSMQRTQSASPSSTRDADAETIIHESRARTLEDTESSS